MTPRADKGLCWFGDLLPGSRKIQAAPAVFVSCAVFFCRLVKTDSHSDSVGSQAVVLSAVVFRWIERGSNGKAWFSFVYVPATGFSLFKGPTCNEGGISFYIEAGLSGSPVV